MKFIFKHIKYENSKTYYAFNFINFSFINTYQVWSINFTFCNLFFKILKEKI
jgi:hypothetical protein